MTRARPDRSYGHRITKAMWGGELEFKLSWTWDRYYLNCRQRFPQTITRFTNRAGAERFAKKWRVVMPAEK